MYEFCIAGMYVTVLPRCMFVLSVSGAQASRCALGWILCFGVSQKAAFKISTEAVVSSEAQMRKDQLPCSCGGSSIRFLAAVGLRAPASCWLPAAPSGCPRLLHVWGSLRGCLFPQSQQDRFSKHIKTSSCNHMHIIVYLHYLCKLQG